MRVEGVFADLDPNVISMKNDKVVQMIKRSSSSRVACTFHGHNTLNYVRP